MSLEKRVKNVEEINELVRKIEEINEKIIAKKIIHDLAEKKDDLITMEMCVQEIKALMKEKEKLEKEKNFNLRGR